jgi:hypothetical protein
MLELIREEPGRGLYFMGRLLALLANIRLGWKWLTMTNALAYCNTESVATVKSFIVQALEWCSKNFLRQSYDHYSGMDVLTPKLT